MRVSRTPIPGLEPTQERPCMTPSFSTVYRQIPLTQGQFAIVDAFLYEWLSQYIWQAKWNKGTRSFYAARSLSRKLNNGKQVTLFMHREILGLEKGNKRQGDHEDHDTLNNTGGNLRLSSASSNMHNRFKSANNKTGYKGVLKIKNRNLWVAKTSLYGKPIIIGYFPTPEDAARAYDKFAIAHHGKFARLNFPMSLVPVP